MAHPRKRYEALVKRASRPNKSGPLYVQVYYQDNAGELVAQTDSDGASCRSIHVGKMVVTRRQLLHHFTESGREGELYAQIRGLQEMLSMKYLMDIALSNTQVKASRCDARFET